MLAVLVSVRADLNSADYDGNTPLLVASGGGHLELAKLLIDAGAGISDANREGNTPMLAASAGGYLELAKVLIDAGADISAANLEGNTPMLATSAGGYMKLAKVLMDAGASISAANKQGNTPLLAASAGGYLELAKVLVDAGAVISAANKQGNTPLLAASAGGHLELAKDQLVKGTLENVRAFISHHNDVLHDPSRWPVLHFVEQLASQETDNMFQSAPTRAQANGHLEKKVGSGAFIQRVNPRQELRAYRWMMQGDDSVNVVAFSPDGSRLSRIEGTLVVVCDTTTGFVECTLTGHSSLYVFLMNMLEKNNKKIMFLF